MAKKSSLPMVVHDHFRKANLLHTNVQKSLGEATKHALETGQELLAAKSAIPHGSWESECDRLFDGSARTAQFYMKFAKDFGKLKSAEKSALLMLEGTLDGAAKAAAKAARPNPPKKQPKTSAPKSEEPADPFDEPDPFLDDGMEPGGEQEPASRPPRNGTEASAGKPERQFPRSHWYKQWDQTIGPLVKLVDKIGRNVNEMHGKHHKCVHEHLELATEEVMDWLGVE